MYCTTECALLGLHGAMFVQAALRSVRYTPVPMDLGNLLYLIDLWVLTINYPWPVCVEQEHETRYSFLSVGWGLLSGDSVRAVNEPSRISQCTEKAPWLAKILNSARQL